MLINKAAERTMLRKQLRLKLNAKAKADAKAAADSEAKQVKQRKKLKVKNNNNVHQVTQENLTQEVRNLQEEDLNPEEDLKVVVSFRRK